MANYRPQPNGRDHYNPLRGLTMSRIVTMEEAANRGDWSDLQWFWHHMVQTDVTVASAVAKRLSHINALDWEIRTIETADPMLAAEQSEVLRYAYDRIENLKEAAEKLALGLFTGFSMLEKVRVGYGPLQFLISFWPSTPPRSDLPLHSSAKGFGGRHHPSRAKDQNPKRLWAKAWPEPDLRYCSKFLANSGDSKARYILTVHGLNFIV